MKVLHLLFVLLIIAVLADPPKKKPENLKPTPPKLHKKGPKAWKPAAGEVPKKERLMEGKGKKPRPPKKPKSPPKPTKGKGDKGKGGDWKSWQDRAKGKGKGDKGKGKGKGNDWRKPPRLPKDRFGPCQACYSVVSYLDVSMKTIAETVENPEKPEFFQDFCREGQSNYTLVGSPRGRGMPIIQGPGLPDIADKLKEGEEFGEIEQPVKDRFERDFNKICAKTFLELKDKIVSVFTPAPEAEASEKEMGKWKAQNKRRICDKYCRKPLPTRPP